MPKTLHDSQDEISSSAMSEEESSPQTAARDPTQDAINRTISHISGHDAFEPAAIITASDGNVPYREAGDEIFDRVSSRRKVAIVTVLSFGAFLSPISSTSVLAATPEVAKTFNSTGSIINLSNAAYMIVMALSPLFWGPMSQVYGRRSVSACGEPQSVLWLKPGGQLVSRILTSAHKSRRNTDISTGSLVFFSNFLLTQPSHCIGS